MIGHGGHSLPFDHGLLSSTFTFTLTIQLMELYNIIPMEGFEDCAKESTKIAINFSTFSNTADGVQSSGIVLTRCIDNHSHAMLSTPLTLPILIRSNMSSPPVHVNATLQTLDQHLRLISGFRVAAQLLPNAERCRTCLLFGKWTRPRGFAFVVSSLVFLKLN